MSNYETRTVIMWLSNEEYPEQECRELVEQAGNTYNGGKAIEDYVDEHNPISENSGLFYELLTTALREVDWEEVAQAFKPEEWGDSDEAPEEEPEEEPYPNYYSDFYLCFSHDLPGGQEINAKAHQIFVERALEESRLRKVLELNHAQALHALWNEAAQEDYTAESPIPTHVESDYRYRYEFKFYYHYADVD